MIDDEEFYSDNGPPGKTVCLRIDRQVPIIPIYKPGPIAASVLDINDGS